MQKGAKFRIYPNREQQNLINQTLGCCRLIYNKGLAMRNEGYNNGKKVGYSQTSSMLTELKKQDDFSFLKSVDSIALQQSLRDLDRSFANFFGKRTSYPVSKASIIISSPTGPSTREAISALLANTSNFPSLDMSRSGSPWKLAISTMLPLKGRLQESILLC